MYHFEKIRKPGALIIISIICALVFTSCTVSQGFDFTSRLSDAGISETYIKTDSFFDTLMEDFSQWTEESPLSLDSAVTSFASGLLETSLAENVDFKKSQDGSWTGSFKFADFSSLIKALSGDQSILALKHSGLSSRFEFKLNIDNYPKLKELVPFLKNENIAAYGPEYNYYLEESEYLEMIAFILGEDGPQSIKNSSVTLVIDTPSDIKDTNGNKLSSRKVEFKIPLIELLLLKNEIYFWCEY